MFIKNISLKPYNTFGIDVKAKQFISVDSLDQLRDINSFTKNIFILSGGSNILLTKDLINPVVHLNLKGVEILNDPIDAEHVFVKVQCGEDWHQFVLWCLENDFGGIENLSLIPGNVGTSPMQNIGAYGVEIKDVFYELEALEIATNKIVKFSHSACEFGYRESVFKNTQKNKYIIVNVTFKLTKINHKLNTSYGAIQNELNKNGVKNPSIKDVSNAVIAIRKRKLPDPDEIGNSGSFFKNPVITKLHFEKLERKFPNIPKYVVSDDWIKVPAGWLVETCGLKGKRFGDAGVHKNQALVLVNYDQASGGEIYKLAQNVLKSVKEKFDIDLEIEVNII